MKKNFVMTAIALACSVLCLRAGILAGPVTNSANGHIYYLLAQTNWVASELEAKSMGGHLVIIDDGAEQTWVSSIFGAWGGTYRALMIGMNDRQVEGSFRWANGAPVAYVNWNAGEPNDGDFPSSGVHENAVHMYPPNRGDAGKWNDFVETDTSIGSGAQYAPCNGVVEIDPVQLRIQTSQVAISWNSSLDINYQVQYISSLNSNTWINLGPPVVGTGSNSVILDSTLDQPKKFYRVISVP